MFLLKAVSGGNDLHLSFCFLNVYFFSYDIQDFREIEISFDCITNFYYSKKMAKIGTNVSFSLQENS